MQGFPGNLAKLCCSEWAVMSCQWECGRAREMAPHFLLLIISPNPIERLLPTHCSITFWFGGMHYCCSVAVLSDSLRPHGLQHARLPRGCLSGTDTDIFTEHAPPSPSLETWLEILMLGVVHKYVFLMCKFITSCCPGVKKCIPESRPRILVRPQGEKVRRILSFT